MLELEIQKEAIKLCFSKHIAIVSGEVTLHCSSVGRETDLGVKVLRMPAENTVFLS